MKINLIEINVVGEFYVLNFKFQFQTIDLGLAYHQPETYYFLP